VGIQSLMPTKYKDMIYVGLWMDKETLDKLNKLVEFYKEIDPWMRKSRSEVIRRLIHEAYNKMLIAK